MKRIDHDASCRCSTPTAWWRSTPSAATCRATGGPRSSAADHLQAAKELAAWRRRVAGDWNQVRVEGVEAPVGETLRVGAEFPVKVRVNLGAFSRMTWKCSSATASWTRWARSPIRARRRSRPMAAATARRRAVRRQRAVPGERSVRLQRPRAAEAPEPAEPVRARSGDVGLVGDEPSGAKRDLMHNPQATVPVGQIAT